MTTPVDLLIDNPDLTYQENLGKLTSTGVKEREREKQIQYMIPVMKLEVTKKFLLPMVKVGGNGLHHL